MAFTFPFFVALNSKSFDFFVFDWGKSLGKLLKEKYYYMWQVICTVFTIHNLCYHVMVKYVNEVDRTREVKWQYLILPVPWNEVSAIVCKNIQERRSVSNGYEELQGDVVE